MWFLKTGMIVHVAHHEEMDQGAKQRQPNIAYSIDGDLEQ